LEQEIQIPDGKQPSAPHSRSRRGNFNSAEEISSRAPLTGQRVPPPTETTAGPPDRPTNPASPNGTERNRVGNGRRAAPRNKPTAATPTAIQPRDRLPPLSPYITARQAAAPRAEIGRNREEKRAKKRASDPPPRLVKLPRKISHPFPPRFLRFLPPRLAACCS